MKEDFPDFVDDEDFECSERYIHNVCCPACGGDRFIIAFMSHRMPKRACAWRDGRKPKFEPNPRDIDDYAPCFMGDQETIAHLLGKG
jgi:hypothetical protein